MDSLSERTKALIATFAGVVWIVLMCLPLAEGKVFVIRASVPLRDGWGWLIPELLVGLGLVVCGIQGARTDTWPPDWW